MQSRSTLHVVFGMSAAGSLKQAFKSIGRDERVIGLPDDLSFGPINPPDQAPRNQWVGDVLGFKSGGLGEWALGTEAFWAEATSLDCEAVAWVCRHSASEYAGFLEWLWRRGNAESHVVDVTQLVIQVQPRGMAARSVQIRSFGEVPAHQIIAHRLWERSRSPTAMERQEYHAQWQTLRIENAPLRAIEADRLVSVPLTFFDSLILLCATAQWQKSNRVVGEATFQQLDGQLYAQVGDLVLIARLWSLVEDGLLEARGDIGNIHKSEVRRVT